MKAVALLIMVRSLVRSNFMMKLRSRGIKPIIGLEAYVASRTISDRDPVKDKASYHLTILAMNNIGYKNLMAFPAPPI